LLILTLAGCAGVPSVKNRNGLAQALARGAGMEKSFVRTKASVITVYSRLKDVSAPVNVYIEGDGLAWMSRRKVSRDPTPVDPVALRLAVKDPSSNVVYIARPGQYLLFGAGNCDPAYWSSARFSADVVDSISQAIDQACAKIKPVQINIIGYSGGGALAVLVAANRQDIASIRTVAGNLDTRKFTEYHKVSPMDRSLNPADYAQKVSLIPQCHYSGAKDKVVPAFVAASYLGRVKDSSCIELVLVPGVSHQQGWADAWPALLKRGCPCGARNSR